MNLASCDKDDNGDLSPDVVDKGKYVLALGVTAGNNVTTYYVVTTSNLESGIISAHNNGIEQTGYRDFQQGAQTIFSIGGLGISDVNAITRNADSVLQVRGDFVFDNALGAFEQADATTMLGVEMPKSPQEGNTFKLHLVDIASAAITKTQSRPVAELISIDSIWPSVTGLRIHGDKAYLTYYITNPVTYQTAYTDTTYVAVYSYPDLNFVKLMKDTRMGPAGSWNAFNGIVKNEQGDMYLMSNSAMSNGYTQSTKNAAFTRIPAGTTNFDSYYFDFETASGGLKPSHIQYIGNGLAFVEVSTVNPQTLANQWQDKNLKSCIVDLYNQTITDITGIPVHDGNGGRRFTAIVEDGYIYYPISIGDGQFMYKIDIAAKSAVRGAEVSSSFVGGSFMLNY